MKKIFSVAMIFCLLTGTAAVFGGCQTGEVLRLYNWGEYMSDGSDGSMDILKEFEEQTGIRVIPTTYESNEAMYSKIVNSNASYDIIIPSDYMIHRMIEEDMVQKINFDNIPNYKYIMDEYKGENLGYDKNSEYSVPYTWGTVGIIYNKSMVTEEVDSWDILWNPKYSGKILMFNNDRDAFAVAQKKLGYSLNTTNKDEINAAANILKEQRSLVDAYVMDEIFGKMEAGEDALGVYYAGDAVTMMDKNEDLNFVVPKEGSNIFVDAMVIPKNAKNVSNAEKFINFLCDPEIGKENIEFISYSTPNSGSYDLLEDDIKNNEIIYPPGDVIDRCEAFKPLPGDIIQYMSDLWVSITSGND